MCVHILGVFPEEVARQRVVRIEPLNLYPHLVRCESLIDSSFSSCSLKSVFVCGSVCVVCVCVVCVCVCERVRHMYISIDRYIENRIERVMYGCIERKQERGTKRSTKMINL